MTWVGEDDGGPYPMMVQVVHDLETNLQVVEMVDKKVGGKCMHHICDLEVGNLLVEAVDRNVGGKCVYHVRDLEVGNLQVVEVVDRKVGGTCVHHTPHWQAMVHSDLDAGCAQSEQGGGGCVEEFVVAAAVVAVGVAAWPPGPQEVQYK